MESEVVVFDVGESDVCEGVVDASVSEGVVVGCSDVVVVGGSVDVSDDSVEDVGVLASVEVVPGSEVAELAVSVVSPEVSCRIASTSTTLFLMTASGLPTFWTEEMRCASSDNTKEASNRAMSDNLAG